jgi:hypothetical protein
VAPQKAQNGVYILVSLHGNLQTPPVAENIAYYDPTNNNIQVFNIGRQRRARRATGGISLDPEHPGPVLLWTSTTTATASMKAPSTTNLWQHAAFTRASSARRSPVIPNEDWAALATPRPSKDVEFDVLCDHHPGALLCTDGKHACM